MNQPSTSSLLKCSVKTSFSKICLLGGLVPLLLATHAMGAVISWQAPTNVDINDPTQVLNNGTAFTVYDQSGANPTLNTVNFASSPHPFGAGTTLGSYGGNTNVAPSPGTSYSSILTGINIMYDGTNAVGSPTTAANGSHLIFGATSGTDALTIGQTYEFQIWAGYSYSPANITADRFSDSAPSLSIVDGLYHASNESGNVAPANSSSGVSQFVVGTFVADATTQALFYYGDATAPNYPGNGDSPQGVFAALQLRAIAPVPEPQTWALAALGASAVFFRLRRKQRSA